MPSDPGSVGHYVSTGIPGLDNVLHGGLLPGGFYLLQGDPGAGKTTIALQFLLHSSTPGAPGLYMSLTESRRDLELTAQSHGWSLDPIRIADMSRSDSNLRPESQYTVFHPSEVELGQIVEIIQAEVSRMQPKFVAFDGLSELRMLAGEPLRYRRQLLALKHFFEDRGITVLLLDDRTSPLAESQQQSLVSGNISMENKVPGYGGVRRRLHVTKIRGSDYRDGYHDYKITQEGVVVYPRLVAAEHHKSFEHCEYLSGLKGLDTMLCGGLQAGTTTLLIGPSGSGKSTLSMKYVCSALNRGERAAVYNFDEVIQTLFERTERLCDDRFREYAEKGLLHVQQVNPAELSPGAFSHEVQRAVRAGARMVVIDSLNGYLSAMPEDRILTTHLHELFAYLNQEGVATILVVAQHGFVGSSISDLDVSYLADTVLILRYFEYLGGIRQAVSVFKKRNGPHERLLRELRISDREISVGEPLSDFHGIMTGVPEYEPMHTSNKRIVEPEP